jgi:protein SCO1
MRTGSCILILVAAQWFLPAVAAGPETSATASTSLSSAGFYLPEPLTLQPFHLTDHRGKPFTNQDLEGRWTLLLFGYTHCPDVCPTTLVKVRDAEKQLAAQSPGLKVAVVFVTLDPERDTLPKLSEYLAHFDAGFRGVGGSAKSIDAFARQLHVKYATTERTNAGYFLDHTSSVALFTPEGQLRALFSAPLRPESLSKDIASLSRDVSGNPERLATPPTRKGNDS